MFVHSSFNYCIVLIMFYVYCCNSNPVHHSLSLPSSTDSASVLNLEYVTYYLFTLWFCWLFSSICSQTLCSMYLNYVFALRCLSRYASLVASFSSSFCDTAYGLSVLYNLCKLSFLLLMVLSIICHFHTYRCTFTLFLSPRFHSLTARVSLTLFLSSHLLLYVLLLLSMLLQVFIEFAYKSLEEKGGVGGGDEVEEEEGGRGRGWKEEE